ncbi:MAG: carbohydrate kinase [Acidobacteria bacterium]|nr:carbohydrate kinase [Acidobacteriota bacterium]
MKFLRRVAIDLDAGSCCVSHGQWNGSGSTVRLAHRFANATVERNSRLCWPFEVLWQGVEEGLRLCSHLLPEEKLAIHSVGADGWTVGYVRLDATGRPLGDPLCYRDPRTGNAMPGVWARIGPERPYELTGIQSLRFNTLHQLYADRRDALLPGARWLNIPEYSLCSLTGRAPGAAVVEYTNATHPKLVKPRRRQWCDEIFAKAGLDRSAAPPIVTPGTRLGPLDGEVALHPAYCSTQVIAPACHDTGAAMAGIAGENTDWAFISSGTWPLLDTVLEEACMTKAVRQANFTNEGSLGGRIRFLKNVYGLCLLEECLRDWKASGGPAWTLPKLIAECEPRPIAKVVFNVDAPQLMPPGQMPARINRDLRQAGQAAIPKDAEHKPEMANGIFASLAARYADVLRALQEVTRRGFRRFYVVGGGSQNDYLNRLIAEHTGLEVKSGAAESSTVGNFAIQFASIESSHRGVALATTARWARRLNHSLSPQVSGHCASSIGDTCWSHPPGPEAGRLSDSGTSVVGVMTTTNPD